MPGIYEDIAEVLRGSWSPKMTETGFSTETNLDSPVDREYNAKLQGEAGLDVFEKMRRSDGAVNASLTALKLPIKMAQWRIEPTGKSRTERKIAEFVEENLFKNSKSWQDTLDEILTCLDFGHSVFEPVYEKAENGIRLLKLAFRPQRTITKWITDAGGSLKAVEQSGTVGGLYRKVEIPVENILIFTIKKEGGNWQGVSILRTSYKDWSLKTAKENYSAISADKYSMGVPLITLPPNPKEDDLARAKEIGRRYRANNQAYIITPNGGKVEILSIAGSRADLIPDIQYHNQQIANNVLTNFLQLGQTGTGTYALAKELKEFFLMSLGAIARNIEGVLNAYLISRLVSWNYGEGVEPPKLIADKISSINLLEWANAVGKLVDSGLVQTDDDLEAYVRGMAQLPAFDEKEREEERRKKEEQAQALLQNLQKSNPDGENNNNQDEQDQQEQKNQKENNPQNDKSAARHTCSHRHASEGGETDPRELHPHRELLDHENRVDWKLIAERTGEGQIGAGKIILNIQATMIKQLTASAALLTPAYLEKIILEDKTNQGRLRKKALDIFEFGREQIDREAEKLKSASLKRRAANEKTPAELIALIDDWVILTVSKIRNRLKTNAAGTLSSALWAAAKNEIKEQLLGKGFASLSDAVIAQEGKGLVNLSFAAGRDSEIAKLIELGEIGSKVFGSSILDGDVCERCQEDIDGREIEFGSDEWGILQLPYRECLGGNRCRCAWVLGNI